MRDWQKFVQSQLAGLNLAPGAKADVIEELAAHLEEAYESLRGAGVAEHDAARRALAQVPDWSDLKRKVYSTRIKENNMNSRVKQLWLPSLLTFALSMGFLTLIQIFGPKPSVSMYLGNDMRTTPSLIGYIPWLAVLPLIGAMGAYLARRAGGSVRTVLVSSLFPILPFIAVFSVVLPVGLIIDRQVGVTVVAASPLRGVIGWVLIPGMALLAGGLLAEFIVSRRSVLRSPAG
jgi:hypothetical protein